MTEAMTGISDQEHKRIRATRRVTILALIVIVAAFQIPIEHWPAHGILIAGLFMLQTAAGLPLRVLWRRWLLFLPLLAAMSLSLVFGGFDGAGYEPAAKVFLRGTVAFMASMWISQVVSMNAMAACLHRSACPPAIIGGLVLMHRQIQLLWVEVERMQSARTSRGGDQGFWLKRWLQAARLIGMLVVRCMRRGDRLHDAMLARGYTGGIDWTRAVDRSS